MGGSKSSQVLPEKSPHPCCSCSIAAPCCSIADPFLLPCFISPGRLVACYHPLVFAKTRLGLSTKGQIPARHVLIINR